MKIRKEIVDTLQELKRIRRKLHSMPEIGFHTSHTFQFIEECIGRKADFSDGCCGVFYLPSKGNCIGFRCELDALEIQEENECDYASKNHFMHACGHDMHMAVMIMTIKYFMTREHDSSLLFIFQPAEESGAGALHMIQHQIFEKYQIKELYAMHVIPNMNEGIYCKEGVLMSMSAEMDIHIKGKGGHVAHQKELINSLKTATYFLKELYELEEELFPHILHVGKIESGEIRNSVASDAHLQGTIRCFDKKVFISLKEMLFQKLHHLDQIYQTTSKVTFSKGYDALVNDAFLVQKIKKYSEEDYYEIQEMALSEDFSFYASQCKICYYLCGITNRYDLHSSLFDVNEEECLKAIELNVRIVESNIM